MGIGIWSISTVNLFSLAALSAADDGRVVRDLPGEPKGGRLALHVRPEVEGPS